MSQERDYYAILQVNRAATREDIERAYERLSRNYRPETSRKRRAAQRHREITQAYEVLSDRRRRAEYDRSLRRGVPMAGQVPASDVLSDKIVWLGAGGIIGAVALVLVLVIVLGGSGSSNEVLQPSATAGQPTACVQISSPSAAAPSTDVTPAPTGPACPPAVAGAELDGPEGLKYIDIQEGTGDTPKLGQTVSVQYTGWLASNGTKFDSSFDGSPPHPFSFAIGYCKVIKGWDFGVATMKIGGTRRLIIPPELGYGAQGFPPRIPANAALIFDVQLLSSEPPPSVVPPGTPPPTCFPPQAGG